MDTNYVNLICDSMGWIDATAPDFSGVRLRLLIFTEIPDVPEWVVQQARMNFRESERTLDMDSYLNEKKELEMSFNEAVLSLTDFEIAEDDAQGAILKYLL